MLVVGAHLIWIKDHATRQSDGTWVCKKTGSVILASTVGRTLWSGRALSSYEGLQNVMHLYCPACNPEVMAIRFGTPISREELKQADAEIQNVITPQGE